MEFVGNTIKIDPPKKPKKMTATRFATVLGLNAWQTPFEAWCAITRTYEKPFEDTIYTIAGKVIEPIVIDYLDKTYFMDLKTPTDVYGADYFKKTWGDFFKDNDVLGGMWDALGDDFVVEIKTTKRAEDWQSDTPIYYKLQACLYAYLLGFDDVVVTASFLQDADYTHPENFTPTVANTVLYQFNLSEEYPDFEADYIEPALEWWHDHVVTGESPEFDEKKDAEILKALRTNKAEVTDKEITKLLKEADRLATQLDKVKPKEDRLKEIEKQLKAHMTKDFRDGDTKVEIQSSLFNWTLSKSNRVTTDVDALKKAGLYETYSKSNETLTLKSSPIGG